MKTCRACPAQPLPRLRLCLVHFREREAQKRDEKKLKKEEKKIKKLYTIKGRKKLKQKAEELLHLYIRKRAMDFSGNVQCYTCRKIVPYEKTNAGHRHHGKLDLDERNLKPQCGMYCNHSLSGNLGEYERHLIEDYGLEWAQQLKQDADRDTGQYTTEFLLETIEKYTELLKQL